LKRKVNILKKYPPDRLSALEKGTICSIIKKDASKPTKRTSEQNDYRGKIICILFLAFTLNFDVS
jgi:hypothetical protein